MNIFRNGIKPSANLMYGLALAFIVGFGLFLRTYFPYHNVFTDGWVRFQYEDAYYHMRLIENLSHHFPHRIYFDPFTYYPHGQTVYFAPFFDQLVSFFTWVIGLGHPSTHVIETVGAYFPAVMGALVTVPVYFIGKELFSRKVGLIAAALIVILPGQFLLRSLLGFTDHHVAETFFGALVVMFLILALKRAKEKELSFGTLRKRDWRSLRKPLLYSLLSGIALGCYLLSWVGAGLIILIVFAFFIIQYLIDHVMGRATDYLCIVSVPCIFIALIMIVPFEGVLAEGHLYVISLLVGILVFLGLGALSFLMNSRNMGRFYYPLTLAVLGGIGILAFYFIDRSMFDSFLNVFDVFTPSGSSLTIAEVRGLSLSRAWDEFTTDFYLALISLVFIVYLVIKERAADKTLFLVWCVIMLAATLGQNRFGYYFAVNVALLTAYLLWKVVDLGGSLVKVFKNAKGSGDDRSDRRRKEKAKPGKKAKRKQAKEQQSQVGTLVTRSAVLRYGYFVIAIVLVFFLAFYPNIGKAIHVAKQSPNPNIAWHDALVWMRENTPDPFQNPDFYYGRYERPSWGEDYEYPSSAYGVMSWWDYGHYITYIAHRIPNCNPHQAGATSAARFFIAQDKVSANEMLDELGSKYIIIDDPMAEYLRKASGGHFGKFYAMIDWAGEDKKDFFETYYQKSVTGGMEPVVIYYPKYYQSMCVRLYIFKGEAVTPQDSTLVISYIEKIDKNGVHYKEISSAKQFATYDEAEAFLGSQTGSNYRIVGNNPFVSPVPLEKLDNYKLVYESPTLVEPVSGSITSYIKIFEYSP